jgi:hypothetical protein
MALDRIEDLLGLHQELHIIYVVDGFDACLRNEDGYPEFECWGHGETISRALEHLNANLIRDLPSDYSTSTLKYHGVHATQRNT